MNTGIDSKTSTIPDLGVITNKYFDGASLEKGKQMFSRWRKGEKGIPAVISTLIILALIGVAGWGLFTYILPAVFAALGIIAAVASSIAAVVFLILASPGIYSWFRKIARAIHKAAITWSPFDEFDDQIKKMWRNYNNFLEGKSTIKALRSRFESTAKAEITKAEEAQEKVTDFTKKAGKIRTQMLDMVAKGGEEAKETDEYAELQTQYDSANSAGLRAANELKNSKGWAEKYAARSNVFAKLDRKLLVGANRMQNMIQDFESEVGLLKKDYEGAQASANATNILKQFFSGKKAWELDFAMDFVTGKIEKDYATTAQNIEELNSVISDFDFNSDDAYEKLEKLSNKINAGEDTLPDVERISNVNHKLTGSEKTSAGPLGNIF
ncbi:MAG: hypothetical protein WAZ12_01445 [Candidatus Absconditicoccaceae bacterium]